MDTQGKDLSSCFHKPSRWNIWARCREYQWRTTSGTTTPRSPYKTNIDDLDGRHDSRRATPNVSTLSLPNTVDTESSWRSVFETSAPKYGNLRKHMTQNIVKDNFLTLQLSLLAIVTGILDAATYIKYHVFATKQTGNMLFLAVYAIDPSHLDYNVEINIGISILAFVVGGMFYGSLSNVFRPKRRTWILMSLASQIVLTFIASAVQYIHPEKETGVPAYVVIALLAFASAGQISLSVGLGEPSLNTVMVTGAIVQLTTDSKILKKDNAPRNSRIAFIGLYLAGCFAGAAIHEANGAVPFLVAAGLKVAVLAMFMYNKGTEPAVKRDIEMAPRLRQRNTNSERGVRNSSPLAAPHPPWALH